MAKRRRKRSAPRRRRTRTRTRTVTRYRTRGVSRRRRRRGGGSRGSIRSLKPSKHELYDMAGAAAYGALERMAKKEDAFFLNKVPKPITALGYAGNVALMARVANVFLVKSPLLAHFAHGTAIVAAYQIARQGELFKDSKSVPTIAGEALDEDDAIAGELDDEVMGALAAEGDWEDEMGADSGNNTDDANETMMGVDADEDD